MYTNVISTVDALIAGVSERAPTSTVPQFLRQVVGGYGVRGCLTALNWSRRPDQDDVMRANACEALAAYAFRAEGPEWLGDEIQRAQDYARKPKPLNASTVFAPTRASVFGDLRAKAEERRAEQDAGRVTDLDARGAEHARVVFANVTMRSATDWELDGSLPLRAVEALFGQLFNAMASCAVNAEARKAHKMPSIAAAGKQEVDALCWAGELLDRELAAVLNQNEGGYVAPTMTADTAEEERRESELDAIHRETQRRTANW